MRVTPYVCLSVKKPNHPTPFPGREGGEYFPPLGVGEGLGKRFLLVLVIINFLFVVEL